MATEPRGVRNNNPGNIRLNPNIQWQGQVPSHRQKDAEFVQFETPEWGIRALARVLITYQKKHNLHSVFEIISRWAPPNENNTERYIDAVANTLRVSAGARIDVTEYDTMLPLVKAIIRHENGKQPYSDGQIAGALRMAGIVPRTEAPITANRSLPQTKTVQGAVVSATGGLAGAAQLLDTADTGQQVVAAAQTVSMLSQPGTWLALICVVLIIGGLAWTIYGRWDARRRGGV